MGELLQSKPDGFASSLGEGAFGKEEKLYRTAKGPISEGAVTEGDWGIPPRGGYSNSSPSSTAFASTSPSYVSSR